MSEFIWVYFSAALISLNLFIYRNTKLDWLKNISLVMFPIQITIWVVSVIQFATFWHWSYIITLVAKARGVNV